MKFNLSGHPFGCAVLAGLVLIALVGGAAVGCTTTCESGAICGSENSISPTTVVTTTIQNPSPSPTASATPGCVAQTAAFVCTKGSAVFEAVLLDTQRSVAASPQPIYVVALVDALNKRADVCAQVGPSPDEITLKARTSNALSETWDVVRADGLIQAIPASPSNICVPARF